MRVLGVDCGSERTGFGLVESDGRTHRQLAFGVIRAPAKEAFPQRLNRIHRELTALMLEHRPECVAIEDIFFAENVRSALKLGHVRGVVMQAAAAQALPVAEYTPLAVKSALTGYGRADKSQVGHMVACLLGLAAAPTSLDASDALAVAICHLHHVQNPAVAAALTPPPRSRSRK
ncbi:MAG: crossover junction endodeoxyribonuclease RuvC [Terriglobales bacterium]